MTTSMSNAWKSIIFTYYSNSRFVLGVRGWKFSTKCSVQFVVFLDWKIVFFQEFCDDIMCMVLLVCQFWVFPNASAQLVKIVCTFVDEIASNLLCLLHAGQLMFPDPDVFSFHTPLISQCSLIKHAYFYLRYVKWWWILLKIERFKNDDEFSWKFKEKFKYDIFIKLREREREHYFSFLEIQ